MLKSILQLEGSKPLSKKVQRKINGGMIPFICDVLRPPGCHCINAYNDYCVFSNGPRQGQYCLSL